MSIAIQATPATHDCHCGKSYHARLCNYRCPWCFCSAYAPAEKCGTLQMRARIEAEQARVPTLTEEQVIAQRVASGSIVKGCSGCEPFFRDPNAMAPRHKASDRCRSGKRSHCTCDTCF